MDSARVERELRAHRSPSRGGRAPPPPTRAVRRGQALRRPARHERGPPRPGERRHGSRLGDDAVDLEALRVLAVHVHAVDAREVPDVLGVGVAPVLLRGVARERGDLALDVSLLERDVRAVREVEVVPGNLVAEDRRPLERAQALLRDRLVILDGRRGARAGRRRPASTPPTARRGARGCPGGARGRCDVEVVDGELRLGMPSSAVASRTSRASVSGSNPGGSERVAIENAT